MKIELPKQIDFGTADPACKNFSMPKYKILLYSSPLVPLVPQLKRTVSVPTGKVFYGQESPRGESTTTVCGVNYQLLAVMLLM